MLPRLRLPAVRMCFRKYAVSLAIRSVTFARFAARSRPAAGAIAFVVAVGSEICAETIPCERRRKTGTSKTFRVIRTKLRTFDRRVFERQNFERGAARLDRSLEVADHVVVLRQGLERATEASLGKRLVAGVFLADEFPQRIAVGRHGLLEDGLESAAGLQRDGPDAAQRGVEEQGQTLQCGRAEEECV